MMLYACICKGLITFCEIAKITKSILVKIAKVSVLSA